MTTPAVAEFFAGVGLARLGLETAGFRIAWANDIERDKAHMYRNNFGNESHFVLGDIGKITGAQLPPIDLAWASFPCTDLSLAGNRNGLSGKQSGTFWQFTRIIEELGTHKPAVVALENVNGLATSHGGEDLASAVRELNRLGYSVDVLTIDARRFVPQSRPRLFLVGSTTVPIQDPEPSGELRPDWLQSVFGDETLRTHQALLPSLPAARTAGLHDYVETDAGAWWDKTRTKAFLGSLSPFQSARMRQLRDADRISYRTAYRRTRQGKAVWEIRADDISGCLRTARGGSSKQAVVRMGRGSVKVRWMTPREYARLMGAPDYNLEGIRANQALFGFGDAVCVPAVGWLARNYLMPLVKGTLADSVRIPEPAAVPVT